MEQQVFILVTTEAKEVVFSHRDRSRPWKETARRASDGLWSVPVDLDTFRALQMAKLEGESDSDTIIRLGSPKH